MVIGSIKMKTKKVTISLTQEQQDKANCHREIHNNNMKNE